MSARAIGHAARAVAAGILPGSKFSGLFLNANIALIEAWARELRAEIVHLGATPELSTPEQTAILKRNLPGMLIMRSVPVVGEAGIEIARSSEGPARSVEKLRSASHREPPASRPRCSQVRK